MADNRIQLPQSGGGLVRYFEDYKSKIEFSPWTIIIFILVIIIGVIILGLIDPLGFRL